MDMVNNIYPMNRESIDLVTKTEILRTNYKANILGCREAWFNPQAITNNFSYANMAQKHWVAYDSKKEMHSLFTFQMKKFKFTKSNQGLYVLTSKIKTYQNINIQLVNTSDKNQAFYTHHWFERAKKAKDLYHALRSTSIKDFKAIL